VEKQSRLYAQLYLRVGKRKACVASVSNGISETFSWPFVTCQGLESKKHITNLIMRSHKIVLLNCFASLTGKSYFLLVVRRFGMTDDFQCK